MPVQRQASAAAKPDFSLDEPGADLPFAPSTPPGIPVERIASAAPAADSGLIEFDFGALSLDLPKPAAAAPAVAKAAAGAADTGSAGDDADPLATKLSLAEEFSAIGDTDGARSLAQEVLAEATGGLKAKAQRFLAELG